MKIVVKEVSLDEALKVEAEIQEFETKYTKESYEAVLSKADHLILIAYVNNNAAGYLINYDRYKDGSIYVWMAGTVLKHRKQGALNALTDYLTKWAKKKGYKKIKIKTRNRWRGVLAHLVKNGFNFTEVVPNPNIMENRIHLEKSL